MLAERHAPKRKEMVTLRGDRETRAVTPSLPALLPGKAEYLYSICLTIETEANTMLKGGATTHSVPVPHDTCLAALHLSGSADAEFLLPEFTAHHHPCDDMFNTLASTVLLLALGFALLEPVRSRAALTLPAMTLTGSGRIRRWSPPRRSASDRLLLAGVTLFWHPTLPPTTVVEEQFPILVFAAFAPSVRDEKGGRDASRTLAHH